MVIGWWKEALFLACYTRLVTVQSETEPTAEFSGSGSNLVPSFIAMFNETEYELDISIYSPIGTVVFEALFIINPNVTVEFLSFDIMMTDEESSVDRNFLINGVIPPLVVQAPYQSLYFLTITIGNMLDTNDTTDVSFILSAFINTTTGIVSMPSSNVTLHKIDLCDDCISNSTCEPQSDGSVNCMCPAGYNGASCNNYNGACIPNPCMNGGSCEDLINDYTCQCTSGYTGRNCSSEGCSASVDVWGIQWPPTAAGSTTSYDCYMSKATRLCTEDREWDESVVDDCQTEAYKLLESKAMGNINTTALIEYSSELSNLTNTLYPILPQDIITASDILDMIICSALVIDDPNERDIEAIANHVATILNNLLNDNNNRSFQELIIKNGSVGEMLLLNSERIGHLLARSLDKTSIGLVSRTIERSNIVFDAKLPANTTESNLEFPGETKLNFTDVRDVAQIVIPTDVLNQFASNERTPVVTVIINNLNSKLPNNTNRTPMEVTLCSQVSVNPMSTVQPINDTKINIYFNIENMKTNSSPICAFWDFNLIGNLNGGWSTEGVTTNLINSSYVQCVTSHLTCFTVLSDATTGTSSREPSLDDDDDDHSTILYVGCGILIFFLLLTLLIILIFRKKLFNEVKDFIHFNVSLSLLLSSIFLIIGNETMDDSNDACITFGVLLHYTLLSAFCWMLCDVILIYILLYHPFYEGLFKHWIFFMIFGWGIPAPIVGISIGIFSHKEYETDEACWLSEDDHAIWGFIAPVILILLVACFILIVSLWKICKTDINYLLNDRETKFKMARDLLKTKIVLLPVLTGAWIIGLFAVNRSSITYSYVFTVLKIFQGIFIFSFYVVLPYIKYVHYDDDYDDNEEDEDITLEPNSSVKGYRFSFSAGIAGMKATIRRSTVAKAASHKKTELVRRQSLSEYNKSIRNEYTTPPAEKENEAKVKFSNSFKTIDEEHVDTSEVIKNRSKETAIKLQPKGILKNASEHEVTKL